MMVHWQVTTLLCLCAGLHVAALDEEEPDYGYQDMLDPTNGTSVYGKIVNETRLVLKLDKSHFTDNDSWTGVDAGVIYDLSITDSDPKSVILWTPKTDDVRFPGHLRFWEPGPNLGWTPFTEHPYLQIKANTSIDDYLDDFADYEKKWKPSAGIVHSDNLENEHGWNITRIIYINALIYGSPGQPPPTNISAATVYVMETKERPYEFVWWEIVPLTWALWNESAWFKHLDVPKSLKDRLLEGSKIKVDLK